MRRPRAAALVDGKRSCELAVLNLGLRQHELKAGRQLLLALRLPVHAGLFLQAHGAGGSPITLALLQDGQRAVVRVRSHQEIRHRFPLPVVGTRWHDSGDGLGEDDLPTPTIDAVARADYDLLVAC